LSSKNSKLNLINIETTSGCASLFGFVWFLVACVTFKKIIKFCEKFEKVLFEFEFKKFGLK
jgi:hypothetical protein